LIAPLAIGLAQLVIACQAGPRPLECHADIGKTGSGEALHLVFKPHQGRNLRQRTIRARRAPQRLKCFSVQFAMTEVVERIKVAIGCLQLPAHQGIVISDGNIPQLTQLHDTVIEGVETVLHQSVDSQNQGFITLGIEP